MVSHIELDKKNREIFKKKKLIQKIYNSYFIKIKQNLFLKTKKPILEVGSSGFIKKIIPNCITSNLQKNNSMIDKAIDVYELDKKKTYSNIIMIDIFHHLKFPKAALKNLHCSLCDNGRVILIEPAMGLIPRIIYYLFHHEPNGFNLKINSKINLKKTSKKPKYYAAQALTWRVFVKNEMSYNKYFKLKSIKCFSDFSYLGSGGFSFNSLYPEKLYPLIKKIDSLLTKISIQLFAARMLIVLEKKN